MKLADMLFAMQQKERGYIADLRRILGDNAREDVIDAMSSLYRAGWNDCFVEMMNAAGRD